MKKIRQWLRNALPPLTRADRCLIWFFLFLGIVTAAVVMRTDTAQGQLRAAEGLTILLIFGGQMFVFEIVLFLRKSGAKQKGRYRKDAEDSQNLKAAPADIVRLAKHDC